MIITNAKYFKSVGSDNNAGIQATIDGKVMSVPIVDRKQTLRRNS